MPNIYDYSLPNHRHISS